MPEADGSDDKPFHEATAQRNERFATLGADVIVSGAQ
jgi:hypothetical protein